MGSKQRGHKGGQGFGNARPVKPLRKSEGKEQAPQELTARRRFLAEMEQIVPWAELLEVLQPFYPQVGPPRRTPPLSPRSDAADPPPAAMELPR